MTRKRKGCLHDTIVHAQIPHYTQNLNYRSHLESTIQIPLQALIRKYPYSVISLKSRSTTGRVCPLQVSGVCRKADISVVFYFKDHFLVQLWFSGLAFGA